MNDEQGRGRPMWINPPRHDDPHERVVVELTQEEAAEIVAVLRTHTKHPVNQLRRILHTVLRQACQWLSPTAVAGTAIQTAAAIAWSRDGEDGKAALLRHVRYVAHDAAEITYPPRRPSAKR